MYYIHIGQSQHALLGIKLYLVKLAEHAVLGECSILTQLPPPPAHSVTHQDPVGH